MSPSDWPQGLCFNPRPREGGDRQRPAPLLGSAQFQSTPPRGGRRDSASKWLKVVNVSIHAPARGATSLPFVFASPTTFQSTPPRGGRRPLTTLLRTWRRVSIHAPARGATRQGMLKLAEAEGFNPRPREGGDALGIDGCVISLEFQSTPPRGGRLHQQGYDADDVTVSIHAPARGATRADGSDGDWTRWFQSTPPRGGRL